MEALTREHLLEALSGVMEPDLGKDIIITGVAADIPAFQEMGITVAIRNPVIAGITGNFAMAIYRLGTQMMQS